ncbi:hypothetical protein [Bacillus cereus]|uniref:hypothetical protein n=1 Tax=Bacillus cereus TaxID=1396 RepID=UPI000BF4F91F|nr:hypothetical protein [Bacillus cereus]PFL43551.1 hypothetical protein COJ06_02390 [Bacillus cereus]PGQ66435.1 hypothetical protein COA27_26630 [Bacillus cereus]
MKLKEEDFIENLKETYDFLHTSADVFDKKKKYHEAKRMATNVRVLLHDTHNSTSLLKHLERKDILYCDSSFKPDTVQENGSICVMPMNKPMYYEEISIDGVTMIPYLSENEEKYIPFKDWWEGQIILTNGYGNTFTRKSIVTALANRDGGAHVDSKLNASYFHLTRGISTGETFQKNGEDPEPIPNPHLFTMRQITYEVIKTLEKEFDELSELN